MLHTWKRNPRRKNEFLNYFCLFSLKFLCSSWFLCLVEVICFSSDAFYPLHPQNVQGMKEAQAEETRQTTRIAPDLYGLQKYSLQRQSLRSRAASGLGRNWARYDPIHPIPLESRVASPAFKLKGKNQRGERGDNRKPLKTLPAHAGHGPPLSFWKK